MRLYEQLFAALWGINKRPEIKAEVLPYRERRVASIVIKSCGLAQDTCAALGSTLLYYLGYPLGCRHAWLEIALEGTPKVVIAQFLYNHRRHGIVISMRDSEQAAEVFGKHVSLRNTQGRVSKLPLRLRGHELRLRQFLAWAAGCDADWWPRTNNCLHFCMQAQRTFSDTSPNIPTFVGGELADIQQSYCNIYTNVTTTYQLDTQQQGLVSRLPRYVDQLEQKQLEDYRISTHQSPPMRCCLV